MDIRYYIGIDRGRPAVSKATLDWTVFDGKVVVMQTQSPNYEAGIKAAVKLIKALPEFIPVDSIVCLEHTGIYNAVILSQLAIFSFPTCLESSLQIKKAGGLQRGKSDRIDAQRIVEYAFRFRDRMRLWQPPRQLLQDLTSLSSLRQRLLSVRSQLQQPIDEQVGFINSKSQKLLVKNCQASLKAINTDLEHVDYQINMLIQQDEQLNQLFNLMTARRPGSFPGIGLITTTEVVLATNEFKAIDDPKKLACHAGVAPFESQSGSSVNYETTI